MLQIADKVKELYKADSTPKSLVLDFYRPGETKPFLNVGPEHIMSESMEIDEALCSDENLEFGSCEATQFKITLVDVTENIKDAILVATHIITDDAGTDYKVPLGRYIVQSADKQSNRKYRDVVALDHMSKFDINVVDWYNALEFPLTLKDFRASLCVHIGVTEYVPEGLPNDDMLVEKTVDTDELIGRNVLIACEQANGVFGHFDRNGVLQHIILSTDNSFYPSLELYPSAILYPVEGGGFCNDRVASSLLISCQFEEYSVKSIDKVQIRQEEGDIGAIYGEGTNCYTVEGNFLMYGKTADELAVLAENIYGMVNQRIYIPYESDAKGLPYIEAGDTIKFIFDEYGEEYVVSYVMKRTLKGIYALRDSYSASGDEIRSVQTDINKEITQLKGKAAFLTKTVDEVSAKLIDVEKNTESKLSVTAEQIAAEVKRAIDSEVELAAAIRVNADNISLMVKKGEVSAQISVESGGVSITGDRFSWTSTNSSLTSDGTLKCKNGEFSGKITAKTGYIGGFTISGNKLISADDDTDIELGNFLIDANGLFFEGVEIDESGISIGSIGSRFAHQWETDTGDIYVNEVYIDDSWWDGWSVTETVQELWEYVHGGGWNPCEGDDCGSDCDCDEKDEDTCSCNEETGGCESKDDCPCEIEEEKCDCDNNESGGTYCPCDTDCGGYNEGPGC